MRLAVCSWSLQPTDPEDLVQKVRACGLDRVQLALSPVVRAPDVWGLVFEVLQDADIAVESGMMETVGEDYSSLESIAQTGGLRPRRTLGSQSGTRPSGGGTGGLPRSGIGHLPRGLLAA